MPLYLLVCFSLFFLASGLTLMGGLPLAMALFPPPVAYYWARGARWRGAGIAACGAAAGGLWLSALGTAVFAVAGLLGMALGGCLRRLSFGWCVAAFTALLTIPAAVSLQVSWRAMPGLIENSLAEQVAAVKEAASNDALNSKMVEASSQAASWLSGHWQYWVLGTTFAATLLFAVCTVTLTARWLELARRRTGEGVAVRGAFSAMRVSEWLVWAAIGAFALGYIDHKWPNDILRFISWNAGIALAAIYWVNGFSVLARFASAMRIRPILAALFIVLLFWLWLHPMVVFMGLFDTWWDFRRRIAQVLAARASGGAGKDENGLEP